MQGATRERRAHRRHAHLPPPALALGGALDDSRQVQQLDPAVLVVDHARDAGERGELIRRGLRLGAGEGGQDGRLAHRREADERNPRVAHLLHVEPLAGRRAALWRLQQFGPVPGQLGPQ
eukprot:scaffold9920_cov122-Isochrysis_galbana.AAC.1